MLTFIPFRTIAYHLGEGRVLKTRYVGVYRPSGAYHLGEGRVLKTMGLLTALDALAYHLGEGRVLKTQAPTTAPRWRAYHLGEGRVLKTARCSLQLCPLTYRHGERIWHRGEGSQPIAFMGLCVIKGNKE